jgi:hypothetical protein
MTVIFDLTTAMCILLRSTTGDRNLSKRKKAVTTEVLTMPKVNYCTLRAEAPPPKLEYCTACIKLAISLLFQQGF